MRAGVVTEFLRDVSAVEPRKHQVQHDAVGRSMLFDPMQCVDAILDRDHVVAANCERATEEFTQPNFVLNHQDSFFFQRMHEALRITASS